MANEQSKAYIRLMQIQDNERYFSKLLDMLGENGVFGWKDLGEILVKKNGKLVCSAKAYEKLKEITGKEFFEKTFELKK